MKYLLILSLLLSCNVMKTLTDGETDINDEFFQKECIPTATNTCGCDTSDPAGSCYIDPTVHSLSNNLLSFWKFEETGATETRSDSVGTNDFLHSVGSIPHTIGVIGNAIDCASMDTGNHFNSLISSGLNFGTSTDISIAFWARDIAASGAGNLLRLDTGIHISFFNNNDLDVWHDGVSATYSGAFTNYNEWYHFVVLIDRDSGVTIYRNGNNEHFTANDSTDQSYTDSGIRVCTDGAWTIIGNGHIDSLGIWDRLLNQEEIDALYHGNNNLD